MEVGRWMRSRTTAGGRATSGPDRATRGRCGCPSRSTRLRSCSPLVPRGYERRRVDAYVAATEQELAELRWEHDDLAAQRAALARERAEQARWQPSFEALGSRVVEVLRLAEQEAAALREAAEERARRREHSANADVGAARGGRAGPRAHPPGGRARAAPARGGGERPGRGGALQRRRDELVADLGDLSARSVGLVHRLDRDDAPPLDVRPA